MKKAELKKIVSEYRLLRSMDKRGQRQGLAEKIRYLEHRYYHETGERLDSN